MLRLATHVRRIVEMAMIIVLFAMVALTFCDVIGRRIFGRPIYGANDITEHLMAIMVFLGLPLVTAAAVHLCVDILDRLVRSRYMAWWRHLTSLLIAAILGLVAWLFFLHAADAIATREVSQALNFPRAPLYIFMSFCCALASLAALITMFTGPLHIADEDQGGEAL